jgi:CheY-like chemotaxis protein/two-component sensor histidine kinase
MLAVAQPDSATSARAHGVMERQVAHMARLLDDLLDVSRITQDKLHLRLEPVDVAAPVRDAVETCRSICQRAGVTVDVTLPDGPAVLEGDHTRLSQVFGNLLTNAAKYTPEGGSVALTVTTTARDIVVSVRDTGIGIPTHMLDRVFEMFSQVDEGSDASLRGLGIGLSLVKRLVEMHRGTVTAHSEGRGRGSEFVVTLPLAAASAPRPHTSAARPATSASSHRVLVVDDDRDSADSLAMVLRAAGHATATAHDGVEAVERAEHFRPDVILLDIGLPRMNGHEACRSIRALPWARDLFIVALTGWGQEADRQQTRDAGFDLHLVKPVDPAGLLAALHEHRRPA